MNAGGEACAGWRLGKAGCAVAAVTASLSHHLHHHALSKMAKPASSFLSLWLLDQGSLLLFPCTQVANTVQAGLCII